MTKRTAPEAALPLNRILAGDCIAVMNALPEASVDLVFADISGFTALSERLAELGRELNSRLHEIEERAYALIGEPINLGSPKQLGTLFFEKLKYPVVKRTKTGYSTDQEVLETLARDHELPRVVLDHRLLETAARVPAAWQVEGGRTKAFLRRTLRGRLVPAANAALARAAGFVRTLHSSETTA